MNNNDVIERIGYLRTRAKLSARALSLAIGKTESYINRLEQKGFEPSMSTLFDIIEACQSTPEEFFYRDITTYRSAADTLAFIEALTEKQRAAIRNLYDLPQRHQHDLRDQRDAGP